MAVIAVNGNPVVGVKYTVTTASSADWASVSVSTYFYDLTDKLVHYKDSTGTVLEMYAAGGISSIPQANKIYVDSINGIDTTGRGNINNPYLTPEYALADITNTGTVTATTANLSATLTAVSSTANIVVGQFITGAGIPYGSTVVSKTVNTIVLSKACTAGATITATWWTFYIVEMSGTFNATGNYHKVGFILDWKTNNATVIFGNQVLFTLAANVIVPMGFLMGNTYGTHAGSGLIESLTFSAIDIDIDYGNYYSIGTGYQFGSPVGTNTLNCTNFRAKGKMFDARFGIVSFINASSVFEWYGDAYGLLGGIKSYGTSKNEVNGIITTPASVNVLTSGAGNYYGQYNGTVTVGGGYQTSTNFYGNVNGTTFTFGSNNYDLFNLYGNVLSNIVNNGSITNVYGNCVGNYTNVGVGAITNFYGDTWGGYTFTVTAGRINYYSNTVVSSISVVIGAGVFNNRGTINTTALTYTGVGKFVNDGTIYPYLATAVAPTIVINNGGTLINNPGGVIRYDGTEVAGLITKTNGTLVNNGRLVNSSRLFVNYNANTSASKDMIIQNSFTNGNGANGGTSKGTGNILYINTTTASTDTSATLYDGTNTITISVVGAGKTVAQINAEMVTLIKASVLQFQCCEILYSGWVWFIGLQSITTTATSLINMVSGTYNTGGGLSYVPNALVYGTEINNYNLNY